MEIENTSRTGMMCKFVSIEIEEYADWEIAPSSLDVKFEHFNYLDVPLEVDVKG